MSLRNRTPEKLWRGRVSVPHIQQIEPTECGAACLGMVLAFHGRWVALEDLRIACGVTRDGSKASNICKAARSYGLDAKGFRKTSDGLLKIPVPAIIHWNFNHYVVLEGLNGSWAWINDPAEGRRRIPRETLDVAYTGVVLAFAPDQDFRPSGGSTNALAHLWRHISGGRSDADMSRFAPQAPGGSTRTGGDVRSGAEPGAESVSPPPGGAKFA